jgi:transcriptional regulator with XRE-family HTH domain
MTDMRGKEVPEPLGARVRRLRQERSLAQDRLAIEANVDQSGLSKFERGKAGHVAPAPLRRIAAVLGVPIEELVHGTDIEAGQDSSR